MVTPRSWLRLYSVCGLAGTAVAVRRGESARLFGIPFPGRIGVQAATIGTGLSAPVPLLLGVAGAASRLRAPLIAGLSALFVAGALGEPVTWRVLRQPSSDPLLAVIALANVALPVAAGVPALRGSRG